MNEWDDDPLLKAVMFFIYGLMAVAVVGTFVWWAAHTLARLTGG